EQFQIERRGMAHRRALRAPRRRHLAIRELDQVQRVLHKRIELVERDELFALKLTRHAAVQDRHRFAAEVLAKLEIFEEAEAVALVILRCGLPTDRVLPAILILRALRDVADRILPLVAVREVHALDDAAAGETQERRL